MEGAGDWRLLGCLWVIWGAITDNWTHPQATSEDRRRATIEAKDSARELIAALGDDETEDEYCKAWIERLGIGYPLDRKAARHPAPASSPKRGSAHAAPRPLR